MGHFHPSIPPHLMTWILQQNLLWVATAPLSPRGHINLSPKGGPHFGLLDAHTFWYMDLSGSGTETIAHLRENRRITVMFSAFVGAPRIVRLWGDGRVLERGSGEFEGFVERYGVKVIDATRSVVVVDVHQVGSSCGYSVPFYEFRGLRKTLEQVFERKVRDFEGGKSEENLDRYWAYKNAWSIDGLPGMQRGLDCAVKEGVAPIEKMVGPWAPIAPYGPKSVKLGNQFRYHLARLDTTQVQLRSVLFMVLAAFVVGLMVATYGPVFLESHKAKAGRILL